jgi:hypothetical protein
MGTWPYRLGESQIWDSKIWSPVLLDLDPKKILRWRGPAATVKYRPYLSSEKAIHINKTETVKISYNWNSKIGRGSQMGAWHQELLDAVTKERRKTSAGSSRIYKPAPSSVIEECTHPGAFLAETTLTDSENSCTAVASTSRPVRAGASPVLASTASPFQGLVLFRWNMIYICLKDDK